MKKRDAWRQLRRAEVELQAAQKDYLRAARWKHDDEAQGLVCWNDPEASWRWLNVAQAAEMQKARDAILEKARRRKVRAS